MEAQAGSDRAAPYLSGVRHRIRFSAWREVPRYPDRATSPSQPVCPSGGLVPAIAKHAGSALGLSPMASVMKEAKAARKNTEQVRQERFGKRPEVKAIIERLTPWCGSLCNRRRPGSRARRSRRSAIARPSNRSKRATPAPSCNFSTTRPRADLLEVDGRLLSRPRTQIYHLCRHPERAPTIRADALI